MPNRLPLFPLSVVLFPGTPLPLHIFEPRYRQLLADCLPGDRRFGITPAGGQREAPDPGSVGCTAEVRVNQELPDGRSNIVVLGRERFVVTALLDEAVPYHVGSVQPFDDDPATTPAADRVAELRELFVHYATMRRELKDAEAGELSLPDDGLALSFFVSAGIDADPGVKQTLLTLRSTARRVDDLLRLLPILSVTVEQALAIHRLAHSNGRGVSRPSFHPE